MRYERIFYDAQTLFAPPPSRKSASVTPSKTSAPRAFVTEPSPERRRRFVLLSFSSSVKGRKAPSICRSVACASDPPACAEVEAHSDNNGSTCGAVLDFHIGSSSGSCADLAAMYSACGICLRSRFFSAASMSLRFFCTPTSSFASCRSLYRSTAHWIGRMM